MRTTMPRARRSVKLTPLRRHLAAVITIALSCAFVAVMVLAGNLMSAAMSSQVSQQYQGADLQISRVLGEDDLSAQEPLPPPEVDGAQDVWPMVSTMVNLRSQDAPRGTFLLASLTPPGFDAADLAEGRPAQDGHEIVVDELAAEALGVSAGDAVTVPAEFSITGRATGLVVSGIAEGDPAAAFGAQPRVLLTEASATTLLGPSAGTTTETWLATVPEGTDPRAIARAAHPDGIEVTTAQEAMDSEITQLLQGFGALAVTLSVFVVIALFTGAVVITNSFAVTLAQRTRSLALLRTLGATRRQVGAVVLRESLAVGALGAVIGVVAGHLLVQGALAAAAALGWLDGLLVVPLSVWSLTLPLIAGVLITLAAGLGPARASTRVAPLQAMRPTPAAARGGADRRGLLGLGVAGVGAVALVAGIVLATQDMAVAGVLLAMAGGVLSFSGVLLALVLLSSPIIRLTAALLARIGKLPARIAGANEARNPRRSAATVAALLIGTTLMTMMAVGARSAESTLTSELDSRRPIDLVITAQEMPEDGAERIEAVQGVRSVQPVRRGAVDTGAEEPMTLFGVDPQSAMEVSHRPEVAEHLEDGVVVLGAERAERFGLTDGQELVLTAADGSAQPLRVHVEANLQMSLVTPTTLEVLVGPAALPALLADLDDPGTPERADTDVFTVVSSVHEQAATDGFVDAQLQAGGAERETYAQILGILLGITVALLAVAVLVALVGVANTLSLGVIERTGENALLRALGTSRRQMRAMLGWEGVLLSLVGAGLGVVIGTAYGALGITAVLGSTFPVTISIPWIQIGAVLLLAVLAGAAASVLPGRAAARTAPAGALARAE